MKSRVLLAIESSGPGGAEQMVARLAAGLREVHFEPIIATLREGWLTEKTRSAGLETWVIPQAEGASLGWVPRFARRIAEEKIDVVHTHEFAMNVYAGAAARLARRPAVATLHGKRWFTEKRVRVFAHHLLLKGGVRFAAVSRDLAEFAVSGLRVSPDRIAVVPNGVSFDAPSRDARERIRAEIGVAPERSLILAVGNLYPVKGHERLVRALSELPHAEVAIAGRGECETALRAQAESLGLTDRLHLLGVRDDIPDLLAACDVFAHPSLSEGLPLAILEAMSAGRPIVASQVGGIPEAVEHARSGLLVSPSDDDALQDALQRLTTDASKAEAFGEAARARVEAEYSTRRMVERYAALYREAGLVVPSRTDR
ncbi:MAG: glycosyltransferase [Myxococcota bacterium]